MLTTQAQVWRTRAGYTTLKKNDLVQYWNGSSKYLGTILRIYDRTEKICRPVIKPLRVMNDGGQFIDVTDNREEMTIPSSSITHVYEQNWVLDTTVKDETLREVFSSQEKAFDCFNPMMDDTLEVINDNSQGHHLSDVEPSSPATVSSAVEFAKDQRETLKKQGMLQHKEWTISTDADDADESVVDTDTVSVVSVSTNPDTNDSQEAAIKEALRLTMYHFSCSLVHLNELHHSIFNKSSLSGEFMTTLSHNMADVIYDIMQKKDDANTNNQEINTKAA